MKWTMDDVKKLIEMYNGGDSIKSIAEYFDTSYGNIASRVHILREKGVNLPYRASRSKFNYDELKRFADETLDNQ